MNSRGAATQSAVRHAARGIIAASPASAKPSMDLLDTAFHVTCTLLALYFAQVRFRARMPLFGHAMLASAVFELIFALKGLDLASYICAAAFVWLYMKSLHIIHAHGLKDGSLS
jgi:hypothetical protein